MLNKVMLIGRLGRDPELRYTQSGVPVTNMRIATDETYTDKDGNKVERTEWHTVVVFQRLAENCANYLAKGRLVYVEGSLQTRKWQDQQGQDRYSTEIRAQTVRFLERSGADGRSQGEEGDYASQQRPVPRQGGNQRSREGDWGRGAQQPPKRPERQAPPSDDQAYPSEGADMDGVPF